ncbi:response regulator [Methanoregula sp.]|uniref:response regulator n=1 Tax=Methanoregula sp. TaxID=2052170 RepID=UPI003C71E012
MVSTPRILIVDDDAIITHVLSTMLQKRGYTIAGTASSGAEAIMKSAELMPDLVMMDVNLSGAMDGMDAAHYIFQLFHCPLIFITGISDEKQLERVKYSQPYGIIFKPFTAIEISTNVDLAIYNHSNRPSGPEQYPAGDPKKIMELLEAILIMDKRGRIIFFNPYAAWLLDIPANRILMKHWRDVLMLINEQTEEQLKDPVTDAANQMAGIFHDSNTAMVTTTSKRRKVKVSVRPVLDTRGKFLAVFMSIKEKSPKPYS